MKTPKPKPKAKAKSRDRPRSAAPLALEVREIDRLRRELEIKMPRARAPRYSADPEEVKRSVARLVLTLVDFVRQLLERQAIRRMDAGTLSAAEIERVGTALMRLEETIVELARGFGVDPGELNLDLGPVGRLL